MRPQRLRHLVRRRSRDGDQRQGIPGAWSRGRHGERRLTAQPDATTAARPEDTLDSGRLRLGFTYEGGEPELLERVVTLTDYLEITPDSIARPDGNGAHLDPAIIDELRAVAGATEFVVHGVGLSIGSASGYSEQYLDLLAEFLDQFPVAWHSEHLGYTTVDGTSLGTMLAMPKTEEVLELLVQRIGEIQTRFELPFLLENIVHLLPDYPGDYSDAGFLNELVARTGCGLLLDVYNLECDAANNGFDIDAFLDELELDAVGELHVAGGVARDGLQLDVHSRATEASTLALAKRVVDRTPSLGGVTYELLAEAVPVLGTERISAELTRIRSELAA
jgi:uncharacterized protein